MIENLNAGSEVAVVERDEFEEACDASKYFFIAEIHGYVLYSPYIFCGGRTLDDIDEVLEYFSAQTAEQESADIYVFPAEDCYKTIQEAKEALKAEIGDDDENA